MPVASGPGQLKARRRLLVARSAELRQQLVNDFAALHSSTAWVERGYQVIRSARAFWPITAGVAGFFLARSPIGLMKKAGSIVSWLRAAKTLSGLWRSLREERARD